MAVNIGSFPLGEADKVLTVFSREKGLLKTVAKSARKPGTKMAGRADLLNVNRLYLSTGRSFEIITQSESLETFAGLRLDLSRLTYGLYYAELSQHFGLGFFDESELYFDYLLAGLRCQANARAEPDWLCLEFELGLLEMLGYMPELTFCIQCRQVLSDYNLATFHRELGGILCRQCQANEQRLLVREGGRGPSSDGVTWKEGVHITPLVWKQLVMAATGRVSKGGSPDGVAPGKPGLQSSTRAARRLIQSYIEREAGRKMKSLELLEQIRT